MGRYNKILLGPATENHPQVEEGTSAVAITPGSLVYKSAGTGTFALATAAIAIEGNQLYFADHQWCAGRQIDDATPIGETVMAYVPLPRQRYSALVANGQNITKVDTPLKVSATAGVLDIGTPGTDHIVAYSREVFNNTTGSAQLVQVRPATL